MDIHKPKPWRGVREFGKELATIVLGVLIALGAEQIVETLRWQEKVSHGEAQARKELSSVAAMATERIHLEKCLDARLDVLAEALLARDGAWTPLPAMVSGKLGQQAYAAPLRGWYDGVWTSLVADGTANHFEERRQLTYLAAYRMIVVIRDMDSREDDEVAGLSVLQHSTVLSRPERNALVEKIEQLRLRNHRLAQVSRQLLLNLGSWANIDPAPSTQMLKASVVLQACSHLGLPT
jgi:hypothetical protein